MIDDKVLKILEFDKVLEAVSRFAASDNGRNEVLAIRPSDDVNEINCNLDCAEEAMKLSFAHLIAPDLSHKDIGEALNKAALNSILSTGEILDVCRVLKASRQVKQSIESVNDGSIVRLKDYAFSISAHKDIEEDIERTIVSETEISDNASYELKEIRAAIQACNANLRRALNSYLSGGDSKYLQENIVTIRGGRYVIPVKAEYKSYVPGLIHDRSATGKALYIEPYGVVEANNELTELKLNEVREIERILKVLTTKISAEVESIAINSQLLAIFDKYFAIGEYCHRNRCVRPAITNEKELKIIRGRHPLIDKSSVVPVTIEITNGERILLVTGPNTGGKTVSLKLTGLMTAMTMSGILPSLDYGSVIHVFNGIYADIGDMQSIENSLSTFSSHISNIAGILENLTDDSLVLFDELGGGTDPSEGAALAIGIIDYLLERGAVAVITTHYTRLKEYAARDKRMKPAAMDFDPITYAPTYKLLMNVSGGSKALKIAERLGLNERIIKRAEANMDPDELKLANLIDEAEKARSSAAAALEESMALRRRAEAELVEAKRRLKQADEKNAELDAKLKREMRLLLEEYIEEADEIIGEMKDKLKAADEKSLFELRNMKSLINRRLDYVSDTDTSIKPQFEDSPICENDSVYSESLDKTGVVTRINMAKNSAEVRFGALNSVIKLDDLLKVSAANNRANVKTQSSVIRLMRTEEEQTKPVGTELDLRGRRVEEALDSLELFIDKCIIAGLKEVRIIHGKGTGALRRAVSERLKKHSSVLSFRPGKYGEGEDGVTIVTLK